MNLNKLHGLSIVVTRPGEAGIALRDTLKAAGAEVLLFPTIAFAEPPSADDLLKGLNTLQDQDWIIFISPEAVDRFIKYTDQYIDRSSFSARLAAVGPGTAGALAKAGMDSVVYPKEDATTEGLLALPEFHVLANQKMTIVKGLGGREKLEQELNARGAHVLPLIVYQRVLPIVDTTPLMTSLNQKQIHVILSTSFDSVVNLCQLTGDSQSLKEVPLIVMSERVRILAAALGFATIFTVNVANHERIVQFLYEKRNQLCQMKNRKS